MILKLFGEKRLVKSAELFPLSIKSMNPIQKYPHITESYVKICLHLFITNKMFHFLRNMFNSKTVKISNIIIYCIQSNPMSSNIRILMKIFYICPIIYCIRSIISRIKSIILVIFSYFKICKE